MHENIISNPTPNYIYFLDTVRECALRLQNVCKSLGKIAYSLKANPHPDVVQAVLCKVTFADVSSSGEIQTCLKLGINPNRLIFVGPYKSPDMLELAIELGFKSIAVESIVEAKSICQLADKLQKSCSVIIRINFSTNLNAGALKMVTNSQFGVELSEIGQVISTFRKNKFVNVDGFHIYTGTLTLDNARVLYRHEITDAHSHFFDLLILQCSLLLGLINEASEAAFDYATKRHSFGRPIIQHQFVADRAADCIIRITSHYLALQQLIYECWKNGSSTIVNNFADFIESLITASPETMRDAIQTFGAASIVEDHPNIRNSYEQARLFSAQLSEAVGKL